MRAAIEAGIQGYQAAAFAPGAKPRDALTGYPLTAEQAAVRFTMDYSYGSIERTFIDFNQWDDNRALNTQDLEAWTLYFWQYARLELIETFGDMADYLTDEMEANRAAMRQEFIDSGWERIR